MRSARLAIVAVATLIAAGCGEARVLRLADTVPAAAPTQLSANQQAARRDVVKLLQSVRLASGATPLSQEPHGDHGWLKPLISIVASSARAGAHAWWKVPSAARSVLAYVEAHPPAGATRFETGSGGDRSGTTMWNVGYRWPSVPGVLTTRVLQVTVTALSGGGTGVLAQAQSDWLVPRPTSERVPAGVRAVQLTAGPIGKPPAQTVTASSPEKVRRLVMLIDAMPIGQPDVVVCPDELLAGARVITLRFDGSGSRQLAQARYFDYPPLNAPSAECRPIDFSVRGRQQAPLLGGRFVQALERIVGANLTS